MARRAVSVKHAPQTRQTRDGERSGRPRRSCALRCGRARRCAASTRLARRVDDSTPPTALAPLDAREPRASPRQPQERSSRPQSPHQSVAPSPDPPDRITVSRFEALDDHALAIIFGLVCRERAFGHRVASSKLPSLSRRLREPAERGLYARVSLSHELVWTALARQLVVRPHCARYIRRIVIETTSCVYDSAFEGMAEVIKAAGPSAHTIHLNIHYSDRMFFARIVAPALGSAVALRHLSLVTLPDHSLARCAADVVAILEHVVERLESLDLTLGCFQGELLEVQVQDVPRLRTRASHLTDLSIRGSWLQLVGDLTRPPCPLRSFKLRDFRTPASVQSVLDAIHPRTAAGIQHMPNWGGLDATRFSALRPDGLGNLVAKAPTPVAVVRGERVDGDGSWWGAAADDPASPISPSALAPLIATPPATPTFSPIKARAPRRKVSAVVPSDGPASRTRSRTAIAAAGGRDGATARASGRAAVPRQAAAKRVSARLAPSARRR